MLIFEMVFESSEVLPAEKWSGVEFFVSFSRGLVYVDERSGFTR